MKTEPDLADIHAMFALHAILSKAKNGVFPDDIARSAWDFAEAMMEERQDRERRDD